MITLFLCFSFWVGIVTSQKGCCKEKVVQGHPSLDGFYFLADEVELASLNQADRFLCLDGCIYTKSGVSADQEFCFKSGPLNPTCAAASPNKTLADRENLLASMSTLNRTQYVKKTEVKDTEDAKEEIVNAELKIKQLLSSTSTSGKKRKREIENCGDVLEYVTQMEIYSGNNDTRGTQEYAKKITNAEVTACPSDLILQLSDKFNVFQTVRENFDRIIQTLEQEIFEIKSTLELLQEEVEAINTLLITDFGMNVEEILTSSVDLSQEIPLPLDPASYLTIDKTSEIAEAPVALLFPVIVITA